MRGAYDPAFSLTDGTAAELSRLCQADITRLCEDAVKESLLTDSSLCDELSSVSARTGCPYTTARIRSAKQHGETESHPRKYVPPRVIYGSSERSG